uniref:Uncharacterized protein n=1 Tax=Mycena chlorophos TaxID=658473 RepID=A0ABQ0LNE5_MYCCL|nr:predicted protein [Mycena chlorophos]
MHPSDVHAGGHTPRGEGRSKATTWLRRDEDDEDANRRAMRAGMARGDGPDAGGSTSVRAVRFSGVLFPWRRHSRRDIGACFGHRPHTAFPLALVPRLSKYTVLSLSLFVP